MTKEWTEDLITRTGHKFHVRPVTYEDEPALAEFFTHVTPEDLRFRFLTGLNTVGHDRLVALTQFDHLQKENFLAFADDRVTVVATAMLACNPAIDTGEVAISIRADFKGRGVSWELLAHTAQFAEAMGVQTLQSIESRDSHAAIELERDMGFTARSYPGDATLMLVERNLPLLVAS